MKITYRAAASQDGYIAKSDGDVAWLDQFKVGTRESGIEEFFDQIDGLVMGRYSYDFVFEFGSWPYGDKPSWICTSGDLEPMDGADLRIARSIADVINDARLSGVKHLWLVGGGQLASSFLSQGLITHLSITELPVKLGSGIPLFANHAIEDVPVDKRQVITHDHFRQIEITVARTKTNF